MMTSLPEENNTMENSIKPSIISVGYHVNSSRVMNVRIWVTARLKDNILIKQKTLDEHQVQLTQQIKY